MSIGAGVFGPFAGGSVLGRSKRLVGRVILVLWFVAGLIPVASAQHLLDGFNTPLVTRTGYPGDPGAVAVQHDGKIVIAGMMRFDSPWLEPTEHVVRLMVDGAPDPTFGVGSDIGTIGSQNVSIQIRSDGRLLLAAVPTGDPARVALLEPHGTDVFIQEAIDGTVHALAEDIDGKTLIAGEFTTVDGQSRNYLARLNADGSLDAGFIATDINGPVSELLRQPNGKLVIAGSFTVVGGQERNRIARLNADGTLDPGFALPTGVNGPINALALQVDGKLVVAGDFSAIGHSARNRIARLNADGSVDSGFDAGGGPDGPVQAIAIRPDGHLVVAGGFLSFDGQARPYRIALLKPNGSMGDEFGVVQSGAPLRAVGIDAPVIGLALQSDGRLLAIGPFAEVDGVARGGLARFNIDGTPDVDMVIVNPNFMSGGHHVNAIHQPDGKMLVSGDFDTMHHVGRRGLARLNADGTLDTGFDPGAGPSVAGCVPVHPENCVRTVEMVLQPDGRIIIYGEFDRYDDLPVDYGLARLNADGSLDPSYRPHLLHPIQPFDLGPVVQQAMLQPDGKLIMEGFFQSEADGGTRWLARFNPDGSIDPGFDPYDGFEDDPAYYMVRAAHFVVLPDGKIVVKVLGKLCGFCQWTLRHLIRLHPDGSLDEGFFLNLQEPLEGDLVTDLYPYLDGSVLISGRFIRVNDQPSVNLGRFRYDGTPDPGFLFDVEPGSSPNGHPSYVLTHGVQADEAAVIQTEDHDEIQGLPITAEIQRVLGNGALDFGFDFSLPQGITRSSNVADYSQTADGRWSMVDSLKVYDFTQIPNHDIGRFTTQEPVHQSLHADPGLARIDWLRSGNSPALEHTHFEISLDGETWIQVGRGQPIPGGAGLSPVHSTVSPPKRDAEPQVPPQGGLDQKGALDSRTQFNGEKSAGQPDVPTAQTAGFYPSGIAGRIASLMRMASLAVVGDASSAKSDATVGQAAQPRSRYAQAARYTAAASLADLSTSLPSGTEGTSSIHKGSPDLAIETVGSIVRNAVVGQAFAQPLQVAVRDENGLVSGVEVTFAAPASGPTASLSSTTVTTNAFGFAEVNATAGSEAGGYTVTATLASGSQTTFHLANLSSNDIAIVPVGSDSQSTPVNEPFPQPLTVRVTDQGGQPVAGAGLWFTTVPGGSGQDATLAGCIDETGGLCWAVADAKGEASVQATANAIVGDYQAGAVVVDVPGDPFTLFNLTNTETAVGTSQVVISQVFSGGSSSAAFERDFIELFNAGDASQDLSGWSVQATQTGSSDTWLVTNLPEVTLLPGQYYLIQQGGTGSGTPLPAPDVVGTQNLSSASKVALVDDTAPLSGACPIDDPTLVGLLGVGNANCFEGAGSAPSPTPAAQMAAVRKYDGCLHTENNAVDFAALPPVPRNSASPLQLCAGVDPLLISVIGGTPQSTQVNQSFAEPLSVRVVDPVGNPVENAEVTFQVPGNGASASLSAYSVTTDDNGEASVNATANGAPGEYAVIAQAGDEIVFFNLTNAVQLDPSVRIVISQVFGGGAATAPMGDFVELFNAGETPQDLSGWSIQSTTVGSSSNWIATPLTDVTLLPGQHYLVEINSAINTLPVNPDATGTMDIPTNNGKVALVAGTSVLSGICPSDHPNVISLVGYGTSISCFEGSGPAPSTAVAGSTMAVVRSDYGCAATHDNAADFVVLPPAPRNTATASTVCSQMEMLTIEAIGGTLQSVPVNEPFAEPLAVRVTDEDGDPVANVEVGFIAPVSGAGAVLSSSSVTTDANGQASVTATANNDDGSYTVIAHIAGDNTAEFRLTNDPSPREKILISQVWAAGGSSGAAYRNDFVELFNAGEVAVDLTGWSLRYGSYTGGWRGVTLSAHVLQPGQHYLIQLASTGSNGSPLPTPDLVGPSGATGDISHSSGKIALLRRGSTFNGVCPSDPGVMDLVGYGNHPDIDCAWGASTLVASLETAALRDQQGCRQTGNNSADFVGGMPQPRNSASPLSPCVGGVDLRIEAIGGTPQTTAIGQSFTAPLTARVTAANGDPVAGEVVTFVLAATSDVTATPASVTATTDSSGEAQIAVTANTVTGSYHARAYTARSGPPATFALTNAALNLDVVSGSSQSAEVNEQFAEPLVVRVTDSGSGLPVENAVVTFSAPLAGSGAVLSATSVATNASGEASITASANSVPGTYSVTATVGAAQVGFDLTNIAPTDGPRVVISQIYRGDGEGSGSQYKNFIELFNAGTEHESLHGWSVQSRNDGGGGGPAVTPLPGIALQPGQRLLVGYAAAGDAGATLPPADAIAPGRWPAELVALASDLDPLTGECPAGDPSVVDFVGTGFVDCAWGTPVPTPPDLQALVRNENGCTQTANNAADFSAGNPLPRNSAAPFTPCDGSGPGEIDVAILSGDNQSMRLNRLFGQPLRVRLTRGGMPVVGQAVSYLAVPSSEGATAALSSTTVVTDANGEASVTATSNAVVGSHVVRAVVGLTNVDFDLTNLGQVVLRSFPLQSAPLNSPFRDIRVQVNYGEFNDELPNIPVQFSVPSSGASALLSAATVVTDSNGEAVVRAAANGIPGSYQVTASIAGSAPPVTIDMTNVDPATATQPWDGWSISDVNLPRNRNVWVRVRGFTADGSIYESVKVFYPTGGFTATPAAGEGGRIEPPIPQGGESGSVLSFSIVPDEGYGIASVTGCDGSLNGSTYLTGPLSADCEIEAVFAGDVETFTVTASAGPGGSIEPDGPQSVTDGETVSFLLLPEPEHVIADVGGTCGGALDEDLYTTTPVTADCSVEARFQTESSDDRLFANGFEEDESTP